jgi:hypothetical protein
VWVSPRNLRTTQCRVLGISTRASGTTRSMPRREPAKDDQHERHDQDVDDLANPGLTLGPTAVYLGAALRDGLLALQWLLPRRR